MFFVLGVNDKRYDLDFDQVVTCDICGRFGHYKVFVVYSVLYVFFIPVFKWNRTYYVEMSCCNSLYELDPEAGAMIERGEYQKITPAELTLIQTGDKVHHRVCQYCGYETDEDFEFCPKCGNRF